MFSVDLDRAHVLDELAVAGAAHGSLWLRGVDLWRDREIVLAAIERRLAVDPYCTLDVVLAPRGPFPLDLLDRISAVCARAPESYGTRHLAHRAENLLRCVSVVIERSARPERFARDWIDAVAARVPVFVEQDAARAASDAERLGDELPGAFIPRGSSITPEDWATLADRADPHAVVFEDPEPEARFLRSVVHG